MSLFVNLPEEVIFFVLLPYFSTKDVLYFDSAIRCQNLFVENYDKIVSNEHFKFSGFSQIKTYPVSLWNWLNPFHKSVSMKYLNWIQKKGYLPHHIILNSTNINILNMINTSQTTEFFFESDVKVLDLISIVQKSPNITKLNFSWCVEATYENLAKIIPFIPKIKALVLNNCRSVDCKVLNLIGDNCRNLTALYLDEWYGQMNEFDFTSLVARCNKLEHLSLFANSCLSFDKLDALFAVKSALHSVYLQGSDLLSIDEVNKLILKYPQIKRIETDVCTVYRGMPHSQLDLTNKHNNHMNILNNKHYGINSNKSIQLLLSFQNSAYLNLTVDTVMQGIADIYTATNNSNTANTANNITYNSDKKDNPVSFNEIDTISILDCPENPTMTEVTLNIILTQLNTQYNHIRSVYLDSRSLQLSDDTLIHLSETCKSLEYITLVGCDGLLTDKSVVALVNNCPKLCIISLYSTELLTDASLYAIADNLPHITQLVFHNTNKFSGVALVYCLTKCSEILHFCINMLHVSAPLLPLQHIANSTKYWKFRSLNIVHCSLLDDELFALLLDKCPHLEALQLYHIPLLTNKCLKACMESCRHTLVSIHIGGGNIALTTEDCLWFVDNIGMQFTTFCFLTYCKTVNTSEVTEGLWNKTR